MLLRQKASIAPPAERGEAVPPSAVLVTLLMG